MGRYSDTLREDIPFTGRRILESGDILNIADRMIHQIGEQGNAWNNEQTGTEGFSRSVDTENYPHISIMGVVSAATDLSFFVSQDNVNFYFCSIISADISPSSPPGQTPDFPADFHIFPTVGGRYVRLFSSVDVIATVTIAAKP